MVRSRRLKSILFPWRGLMRGLMRGLVRGSRIEMPVADVVSCLDVDVADGHRRIRRRITRTKQLQGTTFER